MAEKKQENTKSAKKTIIQYDVMGEKKGDIEAVDAIFNVSVPSQILTQYVRVYQTNQRQGTAKTKTRAEVAGTTKKIYKQKGTGKARHGSQRAPIFKGGGVVGGPQPKEYKLSMNKKQKKLALFGALTLKYGQEGISNLIENTQKIDTKTKAIALFLKKMKFTGKRVLFVLSKENADKIMHAVGNIQNVTHTSAHSLNAFEILKANKIIFFGDSIKEMETHFLSK